MSEHTRDLIERLEKATGADRELDRQIWFAMDQPLLDFGLSPPEYTKSLDAALTLVPEGHDWRVDRSSEVRHGFAAAVFLPGAGQSLPGIQLLSAPTPAIAICIAALRALASAKEGETTRLGGAAVSASDSAIGE